MSDWERIIGLEVHVQLNTKSKLFSSAYNRFGDEPNTNLTPTCIADLGTLPVLNEEAVRKAVQLGLAIDAKIAPFCKFDRKSYFYPDLPQGFQITQFDMPIVLGGEIKVMVGEEIKSFAINHAHLENDSGMLKHFSQFAGVDFNRAGSGLIEIVTEPCMHTAQEAALVAKQIRMIMQYLDASDCNMEEGSIRFDVNCSVRKIGEPLRSKIEIKNLNSFNYMQKAIEYEMQRQIEIYESNEKYDPTLINPGTYRFDVATGKTVLMRKKENAEDYRYFPEPDLTPLFLSEEYIEKIKATLPELPIERDLRYQKELGLGHYPTLVLIQDKKLSDYFESALEHCEDPKMLANWITVEFLGKLKEKGLHIYDIGLKPQFVGQLINKIATGKITGKIAKLVADEMIEHPTKSPDEIIDANPDFKAITNIDAIEPLVEQVLEENQQSITDFRGGKDRAFGFLVGQVMKLSKGKADPKIVSDLIRGKINS